ncbi:hypothetical protein [Sporomusa sp.]|nr:hypothetical protein [Sporomusa sp.]HWR43563.1 hypothetical protein [Sporomusa sp.]
MKSSGSYGEKFYYKLPHTSKANKQKTSPPVPAIDIYAKQEQQFK